MNNNKFLPWISHAALVLFITTTLPVCALSQPAIVTDILFIAYDQGESNAFIQLQKRLDKEGIDYRILAMGRAKEIFAQHPQLIILDEDIVPDNHRFNRTLPLRQQSLEEFTRQISAKVIYSGMASRAQAQLLNTLASKKRRTLAFYDNFDPLPEKEYTHSFLQEITSLDELHAPSQLTSTSLAEAARSTGAKILVTGQPALSEWDKTFENTDRSSLRQQLNIPKNKKIIVFAGGYDNTYASSFEIFIQATQHLTDIEFLVTHHPKYDGDIEQKIITKFARNNVRLIKKGKYSTAELCTVSSAILVHQSTVAQQALYKGIPALYVADTDFNNFITEKGLAEKAYSPEEILSWVKRQSDTKSTHFSEILGVPEHPVDKIVAHLKYLLSLITSEEKNK